MGLYGADRRLSETGQGDAVLLAHLAEPGLYGADRRLSETEQGDAVLLARL